MNTDAEQSTMQSNHDDFVKRFTDEIGVSAVAATIIWHTKQASRWLHDDVYWRSYRNFDGRDSFEVNYAFKDLASAVPPPDCTREERLERIFNEVRSGEEGANSNEVEE